MCITAVKPYVLPLLFYDKYIFSYLVVGRVEVSRQLAVSVSRLANGQSVVYFQDFVVIHKLIYQKKSLELTIFVVVPKSPVSTYISLCVYLP